MSNLLAPRDFAKQLAETLTAYGLPAAPRPVPETLGDTLPLAVVEPLGGLRTTLTIDEAAVSIGVYGENEEEAQESAARAAAIIDAMQYESATWYRSVITTLPYGDPDPEHPTIPRWSLAASVWARPVEID